MGANLTVARILPLLPAPSPAASNAVNPPRLTDLSKPPYSAPVAAPVAVSVTVTDTGTVVGVTLYYSTSVTGEQAVPMANVGGNVYQADIPGQAADTLVTYYVEGDRQRRRKARTPLPGRERRYLTGYVAPAILVSMKSWWRTAASMSTPTSRPRHRIGSSSTIQARPPSVWTDCR